MARPYRTWDDCRPESLRGSLMGAIVRYGATMKCDPGDIACAINRLNESVNNTSGFDWLAQAVIPAGLGLLTLLVAALSLGVALQSNALVKRARDDQEAANRLRDRTEIGTELVELLKSRERDLRGVSTGSVPAGYRSTKEIASTLRPKIGFVDEPAGEDIFNDVFETFTDVGFIMSANHDRAAKVSYSRQEYAIQLWVRTPEKYAAWVYARETAPLDGDIQPDFSKGK